MIPHHVYYQLAVVGFLWLCIMLHYTWPSRGAVPPPLPTEPVPSKFKRKRTIDPKPFAGLTQRPPCAACEHDAHYPKPPPPKGPDPMPATNRRPRVLDTSLHFCPHKGCDYRGWLGLGNLRAMGHPSGGPWRQFYCRSCQGYFLETHGTIFHGKRLSVELIVRVLACLAEGLGIRATARVTVEMAQRVVHQIVSMLAPGCVPAWFSDGFKGYLPAIVGHCGWWTQPERRQDTGPRPKPRWMPLPGLLYAQVVKQYRRKRVVGVKHRVVLGSMGAIEQVFSGCGWKINTSFIERLNLDIRQRVAAIGRRVNTLCQGEDGLQHQLALCHVYYNFVLPHASLRQPPLIPEPTHGTGSARLWRPRTPAMAAGLSDHVWTLRAVLLYRVPPWPQPHAV